MNKFYELRREFARNFYEYRRMKSKPPMSLFGHRMRQARLIAEIPQDRLGVEIGLDEHTASARMSRYETGVHQPPFEIVQKISHVLGVPTAFFYCENDELAELILMWEHLKAADQERIKAIITK